MLARSCGFDGVRGWIYHLAVCQSFRRHGFATRLVSVRRRIRKLGCAKVNLRFAQRMTRLFVLSKLGLRGRGRGEHGPSLESAGKQVWSTTLRTNSERQRATTFPFVIDMQYVRVERAILDEAQSWPTRRRRRNERSPRPLMLLRLPWTLYGASAQRIRRAWTLSDRDRK